MITAKIVALDSSHWAQWTRDAFSHDIQLRHAAHRFNEDLLQLGYTILLSWQHLVELMAVEDEELVAKRLRFIRELPFLSWIGTIGEEPGLGGIVDVMAAEAVIAYQGKDAQAVRREARALLLRSGSGGDVVPDHPLFLPIMQQLAIQQADRSRTITAIAPAQFMESKKTLGELMNGSIRLPAEINRKLAIFERTLAAEITARGDRRITDPDQRASSFIQRVIDFADDLPATAREVVLNSLVASGIDEDEIDPTMAMEDLAELVLFRGQLRVVASKTGVAFQILKRRVQPDQMPHRIIGGALARHGQKPAERKGSDLNDGYLAVLAAYADVLYVDKRTAENFRRAIQKEPRLATLIGFVEKGSSYREIPARLAALNSDARHRNE